MKWTAMLLGLAWLSIARGAAVDSAQYFGAKAIPSRLLDPSIFILKGDADYRLSGINLYRTTIAEAIARFGNPTNNTRVVKIENLFGNRDYQWSRHGVVTRVSTCNDVGGGQMLCSVDVSGKKPDGVLGVTGGGLRLGSTMPDVRRLYFSRFGTMPDDYSSQVALQWGPTIMYLHFDNAGRVNRIILRRASCPLLTCTYEY